MADLQPCAILHRSSPTRLDIAQLPVSNGEGALGEAILHFRSVRAAIRLTDIKATGAAGSDHPPISSSLSYEFPMKHLTAAERDELAHRLEAMKRRALDEISGTAADVEKNATPQDHEVRSQADEAEAERFGDVRYAEMEIDRARLHEIEQAQQRIAEGRYGVCLDCGEEIPRERMLALPTAIRCAACQAAAEGRARH